MEGTNGGSQGGTCGCGGGGLLHVKFFLLNLHNQFLCIYCMAQQCNGLHMNV